MKYEQPCPDDLIAPRKNHQQRLKSVFRSYEKQGMTVEMEGVAKAQAMSIRQTREWKIFYVLSDWWTPYLRTPNLLTII